MLFGEQAREDLLLPPSPEGAEDVLFRRGAPLWGGGSLAEALLPLVETPPAPAAPRPCYLRYKTELCSRYAAAGACRYAERCQFAHGLRELRVPARHPKYKTEPCRAFHTAGVCPYGARCLFVHAPEELRVPGARPRAAAATAPCRTYLAFGVCPYGARCHFLHADGKPQGPPEKGAERGRPSLCRTFLAFGFCLYGTRCLFRHAPAPPAPPPQPPLGGGAPDRRGDPPLPPPPPPASNAFTFASRQLGDLLLPLAWGLGQLDAGSPEPAARSPGKLSL